MPEINMEAIYLGVVEMKGIDNIRPPEYALDKNSAEDLLLTENHIKIVHYPDCQQLIIWLPEYHGLYEDIAINDVHSGLNIYSQKISDVVGGSIQIIIDTLFIYPGEFVMTISKIDGLQHNVTFVKYQEGVMPEVPENAPDEPIDFDKPPIEYRDGFGNVLPNEDLMLREQIINKTINKITRRLEYISHGRDGEVVYTEGEKHIKFLMEMGAYDCVFYINIPSEAEWETTSTFPLSEREDIITFVAEQTQRDQSSSCDFTISEKEIAYYKKK